MPVDRNSWMTSQIVQEDGMKILPTNGQWDAYIGGSALPI